MTNMQGYVRNILNTKEATELIQSYVRINDEEAKVEKAPKSPEKMKTNILKKKTPTLVATISRHASNSSMDLFTAFQDPEMIKCNENEIKKRRRKNKVKASTDVEKPTLEIYTDKDRAAAVCTGAADIKQSLKQQQKHRKIFDKKVLKSALPDHANPDALLELGLRELQMQPSVAIQFFDKAIELNPGSKRAWLARSKCSLLLSRPDRALIDAEQALRLQRRDACALHHKAEALYYLGQFEQSLMMHQRALRARPKLRASFLGVKAAQEAIENSIGPSVKLKIDDSIYAGNNKPKAVKKKKLTAEINTGIVDNDIEQNVEEENTDTENIKKEEDEEDEEEGEEEDTEDINTNENNEMNENIDKNANLIENIQVNNKLKKKKLRRYANTDLSEESYKELERRLLQLDRDFNERFSSTKEKFSTQSEVSKETVIECVRPVKENNKKKEVNVNKNIKRTSVPIVQKSKFPSNKNDLNHLTDWHKMTVTGSNDGLLRAFETDRLYFAQLATHPELRDPGLAKEACRAMEYVSQRQQFWTHQMPLSTMAERSGLRSTKKIVKIPAHKLK